MAIKTIPVEGVTEAKFAGNSNFYAVRNDGTETLYVSALVPDCTAGADGVISIPAGGSCVIDGYNRNTLFLNGGGTAMVIGQGDRTNPFKGAGKGGGSSGGSALKILTFTPGTSATNNYAAFVAWFDENIKPLISGICDIEYDSPYNDAGDWLIWRPKQASLRDYFGGVQYYGGYINLQAYYNSTGGHSHISVNGVEIEFMVSDDTIIASANNSVHYMYIRGIVVSAGNVFW